MIRRLAVNMFMLYVKCSNVRVLSNNTVSLQDSDGSSISSPMEASDDIPQEDKSDFSQTEWSDLWLSEEESEMLIRSETETCKQADRLDSWLLKTESAVPEHSRIEALEQAARPDGCILETESEMPKCSLTQSRKSEDQSDGWLSDDETEVSTEIRKFKRRSEKMKEQLQKSLFADRGVTSLTASNILAKLLSRRPRSNLQPGLFKFHPATPLSYKVEYRSWRNLFRKYIRCSRKRKEQLRRRQVVNRRTSPLFGLKRTKKQLPKRQVVACGVALWSGSNGLTKFVPRRPRKNLRPGLFKYRPATPLSYEVKFRSWRKLFRKCNRCSEEREEQVQEKQAADWGVTSLSSSDGLTERRNIQPGQFKYLLATPKLYMVKYRSWANISMWLIADAILEVGLPWLPFTAIRDLLPSRTCICFKMGSEFVKPGRWSVVHLDLSISEGLVSSKLLQSRVRKRPVTPTYVRVNYGSCRVVMVEELVSVTLFGSERQRFEVTLGVVDAVQNPTFHHNKIVFGSFLAEKLVVSMDTCPRGKKNVDGILVFQSNAEDAEFYSTTFQIKSRQ